MTKHESMNFNMIPLIISLALVSESPLLEQNNDGNTTTGNHIILISIDGLAAFHLENEKLAGSFANSFTKCYIATGVSPQKHGILNNRRTDRETIFSFRPSTLKVMF